jgi:hypothetical protein
MRAEKLDGGMVLKHKRERIYSESEVAKATNNYDDQQKLGQGSFGYTYTKEFYHIIPNLQSPSSWE